MTRSADDTNLDNGEFVVAALPHLIGFRPSESLVLLWMDGARLLLTERVDIPAASWPAAGDRLDALLPEDAVRRADGVVAVLVTDREWDLADATAFADVVCDAIRDREIAVYDLLLLAGDRWRSLRCEDSRCCPPAGRLLSEAARARAAETFAFAGRRVLPDRAAVAAQVACDPSLVAPVGRQLPVRPRQARRGDQWRDRSIANIIGILTSRPAPIAPDRCARTLRDLSDIRVRDTVLWDLAHLDADGIGRAAVNLTVLTRSAPDFVCAPAATCCAIAAWLAGDAVLASAAVVRALTVEPDYGLALLIRDALQAGWSPARWRGLVAELDRSTCRTGDLPSGHASV